MPLDSQHPAPDREEPGNTGGADKDTPLETEGAGGPLSIIARDRVLRISRDGRHVEVDASGQARSPASEGADALFSGSMAGETLRAVGLALDTGASQRMTFRQPAGGEMREYEAMLVPCAQGEVVALVHDVSKRRRLEERLLHTEKMGAFGLVASGIAHDFNNILTAIMGYSQLALREAGSTGGNISAIQKAAERGAELCRRLLALSRHQSVQAMDLDLNELVLDIAPLLGTLLAEDIELVSRTEPELGLVKVDPGQIEHVIVNLAINASDAMPGGGTLTVATANVAVDETPPEGPVRVPAGEYVVLSVADTGRGISEEVRPHIFEPFFTTKQPDRGTGLGLFMCRNIVAQNGGYMDVHSRPGTGTTFEVYLPRTDVSAVPPRPRREVAVLPSGEETVLLVEDERVVREVSARILRDRGYTVIEAAEGGEALRLAREHQEKGVDLLFTDVVMPFMNGWDLARRMRAVMPGIRVLYTSGHSQDTIGYARPCDLATEFIEKPFTPTELTRRVRAVLDT